MPQLDFLSPKKSTSSPAPPDVSGFESFYPLLRVLAAVQDERTFYERLRVLLLLACWQGEPPTAQMVARPLGIPADDLAQTLNKLRGAGWLVSGEDDRRYSLTAQGRILIALLQLLAQPWQEGDDMMVAIQSYVTASGLEVRRDLLAAQFELVLSTLEERARQVEAAQEAEDTELVSHRLRQSNRDVRIANKALELRRQGATAPDDYDQVQRMHLALSQLTEATARLDTRYQKLLARDLLAQGLVTLGDIRAWAREAPAEELARALLPYLRLPFLSLWALPETVLLDAGIELAGRVRPARSTRAPEPIPLASLPPTVHLDEIKQQIYRQQAELRARLAEVDPLPLADWVDQATWAEAVTRFVAALDPELRRQAPPIYAQLDADGQLADYLRQAVAVVTVGQLSLKAGQDE